MKRSFVRKILMVLLSTVLLISGGYAYQMGRDFQEEAAVYQEAQDTFVTVIEPEIPLSSLPTVEDTVVVTEETVVVTETVIPEEETTEVVEIVEPIIIAKTPDITVDFDGLRQVNEDVVAWIYLPNSPISYPVLQGEDNQAYLHRTYGGAYSAAGSIFMDYRNEGDLSSKHTVLYGHNMVTDTMFGSLDLFRSASYLESHPYFFLLTESGYLRYEICYVIVTSATSSVYDFQLDSDDDFQTYIEMLESVKLYDTGVSVTAADSLVTLSTCTSVTEEQRLVIIGRMDEANG